MGLALLSFKKYFFSVVVTLIAVLKMTIRNLKKKNYFVAFPKTWYVIIPCAKWASRFVAQKVDFLKFTKHNPCESFILF
jgi:hypothetical protein